MRIVVALGGNALLRRGEPMTAAAQRVNIAAAAAAIAPLLSDHQVVLTHGNGPQVGLLALQNDAYSDVDGYPLDILDAETEGMIGYLLELELARHTDPRRLATLLTQVVVDHDDPAFGHPRKFVGPVYDEAQARQLAAERDWAIAPDGQKWRRVVPSPEPREIVEIAAIRTLSDSGFTVICGGGGGIPITAGETGMNGVEAVIDKDLVSARLATDLDADALLLLTDVDGIYCGWDTTDARRIDRTTPDRLRAMTLPAGSMQPKAEAVCRFIDNGGRLAAVGALVDAEGLLAGTAGTTVSR